MVPRPNTTPKAMGPVKRIPLLLLAAVTAACADRPAPTASAGDLRPALAAATTDDIIPGSYIIMFRNGTTDAPGLSARLAAQNGGKLHRVYSHALQGFAASLPASAAEALRRNPNVLSIEPDRLVRGATLQDGATWGLDRIDQDSLPLNSTYSYELTGNGVTAYILDSGINYSHQEFSDRVSFGYDAIGDGFNGNDCNGHGTHVAGTVGGTTYGVAKKVRLVSVRVLDCGGSGRTSGVIAAVDWVTANHVKPAVANMSVTSGASAALDTAVNRSIRAGITYVAAAGNAGRNACNYSPARVPAAITVGASDRFDRAPGWSNYGSCIDLFAPGADIESATWDNDFGVALLSGTSMSAPHVAGVAALFVEANGSATPQQVRDAIYEQTVKGIVREAYSVNNHLLRTKFTNLTPPPNAVPTAQFTYACDLLTCWFQDNSTDSDGQVTSWQWAFGDGQSSTAAFSGHTYATGGTYTVTLSVTDNVGATSSTSQVITVAGAPSGGDGGGNTGGGTEPAPFSLSATGRTAKGQLLTDLSWSGTTSARIDIYRNGARVTTTDNDGFHTDVLAKGATGTFTYRVCAAETTTCSNEAIR